ncbi:hypothetical protein [Candidatus Pristimantibacillus sp. PTI5]|uniref:hypothetical protein n=1 Tax=Candidatus Pristimantibacillus sp. PTI5 TaxID=3400422 RepID=UPI003B0211D3
MEPQKTGKRSIALPITLVILVFSLIGNVFLYSQFLQHKQENNYEKGQRIFAAAIGSQQYAKEMQPLLEALLASKSMADRLGMQFDAGKATAKGQALTELAIEAASLSDQPGKWNEKLPASFVSGVETGLQEIGRYEGPLNEADRAYLTELKDSFEKISGILSGFNSNIGESRIAVIRLSSGLDWIELAEQLQDLMTEKSAN